MLTETVLQRRVFQALDLELSDPGIVVTRHDAFVGTHRNPIAKRIFDIGLTIPLLLVLAPLLILCMVAIRLGSAGPAIFRQTRSGLHGNPFTIYKLRTMRMHDEAGPLRQAQRNDSRVTRIGAFLRRTSIDELPQLVNVLKGDMSLIGPRPHAITHDRHYAVQIDRYYQRLAVKPGITGLAQVSNLRGECLSLDDMQARVEADCYYALNASLKLDLVIMLKTLPHMIFSKCAY